LCDLSELKEFLNSKEVLLDIPASMKQRAESVTHAFQLLEDKSEQDRVNEATHANAH